MIYSSGGVTVAESGFRDDLVDAHLAVVAGLAEPGTWWNAAERVAIASET